MGSEGDGVVRHREPWIMGWGGGFVVPERQDGWKAAFGNFLLARQAGFDVRFAGAEGRLGAVHCGRVADGVIDLDGNDVAIFEVLD